MHNFTKKAALLFLLFFVSMIGKAQLQITEVTNAQALSQRLVGEGIIISNITLNGAPVSTGFFRNGLTTSIGLDSGIALSTGRVKTLGTNYGLDGIPSNFASEDVNTPGDPTLQTLVTNPTNDAVVLEFDFVPIGDTIRFRYVMSSEEYPSFDCSSFNDVFGFFISGPGITGNQNIALIPGTNIPVAINSVNNNTSNDPDCTSMGPGSPFAQYFVPTSVGFTHNAHTTVFTAWAVVVPCQTYHLKLAIADVQDGIYDSNVFLEARSLQSSPLNIVNNNPVSGTGLPYLVEGCQPGAITITRNKKLPTEQPITLVFAGTAVNGTDVTTIPSTAIIPANDSVVVIPIQALADNLVEGNETLKIYVSSACASSLYFSDSISIEIRDQIMATASTVNNSCTAPGSVTITPSSGTAPFTYSMNGGTTYQNSGTFGGLTAGTYNITVRDASGCTIVVPATLTQQNNLTVTTVADQQICAGGSFTATTTSNGAATYSWTGAGVSNPTAQSPVITPTASGQYTVTATLGNCTATDVINVTVNPSPQVNAGADQIIIAGDVVQLQGSGSAGTYLWTPATGLSATNILNPMANPATSTNYTLQVTNPQGCTATDNVTVTVVPYCVQPMEAFTPNGDGMNDVWLITNGNCLRTAKVQVYNRYGNLVYEAQNYTNNWDGTYKGKPLADGTYYFVITYQLINGKPVHLRGNVTILR